MQTFALPLGDGTKEAVDETRTRDLHLGKVALYQLSYYRTGALGRNRTTDTVIFSHMLYRLSYQGIKAMRKGLEPSTSSVTGWHSNQLNYRTIRRLRRGRIYGNNRARTCDPLLVRQMLSQLSYAPESVLRSLDDVLYNTPIFRFCQPLFAYFFKFSFR